MVKARNEKRKTNSKDIFRSRFSLFVSRFSRSAFAFGFLVYISSPLVAAPSQVSPSQASTLEEGKALYETGRYQDAISKFIMVLRSDPQNPEARQYLRESVDQMRQNPAAQRNGSNSAPVHTEMREMLQKRAALALDLAAIPGVQIATQGAVTQVAIASSQLFPDNKGGLKEEGIPTLDRVAAWLKTFGQQPILIHCYPEEMQEVTSTGSLFLERYSALYNFFIEERKLAPQRLISADMLGEKGSDRGAAKNVIDTSKSRVVIETLGSQSSLLDGAMPSSSPKTAITRWLEFAIISHRDMFTPEEGEWATLDIAALSRTGLRSWTFDIVPEAPEKAASVVHMAGTGNVLKRFIWEGRNDKTGSLVPGGAYVARITATDSDGTIKNEQVTVRVERTTEDVAPAVAAPAKVKKSKAKKKKKKAAAETSSAPSEATAPVPETPSTPAAPAPEAPAVPEAPAASAAPAAVSPETPDADDDSAHAMYKQVIRFDAGAGELAPSVVPSLENIGRTLDLYPLQKLRIVGCASTSETNASALAKKRAEEVRDALEQQYHVDPKRILMGDVHVKAGAAMSKVELSISN